MVHWKGLIICESRLFILHKKQIIIFSNLCAQILHHKIYSVTDVVTLLSSMICITDPHTGGTNNVYHSKIFINTQCENLQNMKNNLIDKRAIILYQNLPGPRCWDIYPTKYKGIHEYLRRYFVASHNFRNGVDHGHRYSGTGMNAVFFVSHSGIVSCNYRYLPWKEYSNKWNRWYQRQVCLLNPEDHRHTCFSPGNDPYSISQEICTRFLLCCALLWLYIDIFYHIHQAYFTGTVAI